MEEHIRFAKTKMLTIDYHSVHRDARIPFMFNTTQVLRLFKLVWNTELYPYSHQIMDMMSNCSMGRTNMTPPKKSLQIVQPKSSVNNSNQIKATSEEKVTDDFDNDLDFLFTATLLSGSSSESSTKVVSAESTVKKNIPSTSTPVLGPIFHDPNILFDTITIDSDSEESKNTKLGGSFKENNFSEISDISDNSNPCLNRYQTESDSENDKLDQQLPCNGLIKGSPRSACDENVDPDLDNFIDNKSNFNELTPRAHSANCQCNQCVDAPIVRYLLNKHTKSSVKKKQSEKMLKKSDKNQLVKRRKHVEKAKKTIRKRSRISSTESD